ncbi:unnamed protein product [Phaedon cochleariae]|uniref:Uncharacterized protein n=1 Tax=Phaedon cochleariae TaxID=80249 RepID=A0A9P0GXX1_PHACE|nr:unnamed protein product [Phaedon cochleariae]
MPPAPFNPSGDPEEDIAFKVLNQDNLPMAIIGEPILKPFDKSKPNVIVHPTRRINTNILDSSKSELVAKSNDCLNSHNINKNNNYNNDKSIRKSTSNSYNNIDVKMKIDDLNKFTTTLDLKLKRLQKEELTNRQNKKSPTENLAPKKPFVTTVKKGQFLEPPAEIVIKSEEQHSEQKKAKEGKKLYAFASRPRVLSRTPPKSVHQTRCDAAARAHAKLVGTVVGIRTEEKNTGFSPSNENVSDRRVGHQSYQQVNTEIGSRASEAKRRSLARKRAKNQQFKSSQIGVSPSQAIQGIETYSIDQVQKTFADLKLADIGTQTEKSETGPNELLKSDAETQIYPGDLYDFEKEVQPVIEVLVGRTIEQALIEVLEEEELAALKEQQRRFIDMMSNETAESMRMAKLNQVKKHEEIERQMVTATVAQHNYRPQLITSA